MIMDGFLSTIQKDALANGLEPTLKGIRQGLKRINFSCVFWLRVNQLWIRKGWRGARRLRQWRQYRFANDISPYAQIGAGFHLGHTVDITIGSSATIGENVTIYNGVTIVGMDGGRLPQIGDGVTIFTGAKIVKPVTIGDNCIIGALSLVRHDIPSNHIFYGLPPFTTLKPRK